MFYKKNKNHNLHERRPLRRGVPPVWKEDGNFHRRAGTGGEALQADCVCVVYRCVWCVGVLGRRCRLNTRQVDPVLKAPCVFSTV